MNNIYRNLELRIIDILGHQILIYLFLYKFRTKYEN